MFKEYIKKEIVKAKIFEKGNEDGFVPNIIPISEEDRIKHDIPEDILERPYVYGKYNSLEGGTFGDCYLVIDNKGIKKLIPKDIFEANYQENE